MVTSIFFWILMALLTPLYLRVAPTMLEFTGWVAGFFAPYLEDQYLEYARRLRKLQADLYVERHRDDR